MGGGKREISFVEEVFIVVFIHPHNYSKSLTNYFLHKISITCPGIIAEGLAAGITIFDEKEVKDIATFEKPHAYSKGFHYVIVNEVLTIDNEKHNGNRASKALYGPGYKLP